MESLGLYLSVPFCRSKCSFCNFASGVHRAEELAAYAELLAAEIGAAGGAGAGVDTLYWGGGTPSLLPPASFAAVMAAVRAGFEVAAGAEHTVEVAPGTLTPAALAMFRAAGVNRLSFGAQSFQDEEVRAVGRLHRRATVLEDLARARAAGFANVSLDLIVGLPHQTEASWRDTVERALATGVPHLSVYMLEVDEDSRLGQELLAGGVRYHAHAVPDEDMIADGYEWAVERIGAGGLAQYEISNFARPGWESRHNERYWLRRPYWGFGVDAHSFVDGCRWANPDHLEAYRRREAPRRHRLTAEEAEEERWFLGLRRNAGVAGAGTDARVAGLVASGLLEAAGGRVRLTARGRLLSNRVFAEFLAP